MERVFPRKVVGIDPSGRRCLDLGASTGGFTDCLLQAGAREVVAVDVGYGQLDSRLRADTRVRVLERTNARTLEASALGGPVELVTLPDGSGVSADGVPLRLLDEPDVGDLYNFCYAERGARRPDPPAVLEATTRAAARFALELPGVRRVVHGGRSMGGRIASQVVAAGERADGLAFLGYPLHPPGQFEKRRQVVDVKQAEVDQLIESFLA